MLCQSGEALEPTRCILDCSGRLQGLAKAGMRRQPVHDAA
jgi:hypothetical protein